MDYWNTIKENKHITQDINVVKIRNIIEIHILYNIIVLRIVL